MCYDRESSVSEARAKAEAERRKEEARRTETVGKILREADEGARAPAEPAPAKESAPAK